MYKKVLKSIKKNESDIWSDIGSGKRDKEKLHALLDIVIENMKKKKRKRYRTDTPLLDSIIRRYIKNNKSLKK